MKKIIAILFISIISLSVFSGCSEEPKPDINAEKNAIYDRADKNYNQLNKE